MRSLLRNFPQINEAVVAINRQEKAAVDSRVGQQRAQADGGEVKSLSTL